MNLNLNRKDTRTDALLPTCLKSYRLAKLTNVSLFHFSVLFHGSKDRIHVGV